MKLVPVGKHHHAMVDDADYDDLMRYTWFRKIGPGRVVYAARRVRGSSSALLMHKYLTGYTMTDHIDGNGLNNQRDNLRETTPALNALNKIKLAGSGLSRFKGVSWRKEYSMWRAQCPKHRVIDARLSAGRVHLGFFWRQEDAALAYDAAVRLRYGPLATYNFPRPGERSALTGLILPELVLS